MITGYSATRFISFVFRITIPTLFLLLCISSNSYAQKKDWTDRLLATKDFMKSHMWNANTLNYLRRSDMPSATGSDAWGITIVLDAYAYMVEESLMQPSELKGFFQSSSALYEKTGGANGARILARQGSQIYIGGDDDLQWSAALAHCYQATKDSEYLFAAQYAFQALIDQGFWKEGLSKGWAWNSSDSRPNGVSTAYGALAAARLFAITHDDSYKKWAAVSINALKTPQVGFFPRDMMVAANAALTVYETSKQKEYLDRAIELAGVAKSQVEEILKGSRTGELNPTDVGDLAEGFDRLFSATHVVAYQTEALRLVRFFVGNRTDADIQATGFYSRYKLSGQPDEKGNYIGVPLNVRYLPEVAEMLKLFAVAIQYNGAMH